MTNAIPRAANTLQTKGTKFGEMTMIIYPPRNGISEARMVANTPGGCRRRAARCLSDRPNLHSSTALVRFRVWRADGPDVA